MRKNVKTYILVAVLALSCYAAAAQTALPFLRIDRNPVSSGMAAAGKASLSSPAWAAFGNSAVIPFAPGKVNAGLSYESWAPAGAKTSNIDAGVSFKAGEKFGLSLGFASGTGAAFTRTDDAGNITGEVSPRDLIVGGGFGLKFGGNFGAGANVRFASQSFDANKYSAVCADVFVLYRKDALGVSAGVSSLGTSVKGSSGEAYPLPASATVAADYTAAIAPGNELEAALDIDYFLAGGLAAALGLQYSYNDMVFVRAGYHYGGEGSVLPSYASLGAGFKYKFARLDVAWLTANEVIGNTLCVGLGLSF